MYWEAARSWIEQAIQKPCLPSNFPKIWLDLDELNRVRSVPVSNGFWNDWQRGAERLGVEVKAEDFSLRQPPERLLDWEHMKKDPSQERDTMTQVPSSSMLTGGGGSGGGGGGEPELSTIGTYNYGTFSSAPQQVSPVPKQQKPPMSVPQVNNDMSVTTVCQTVPSDQLAELEMRLLGCLQSTLR